MSGDRNTQFFHFYASARNRRKAVTLLEIEGIQITGDQQIREAFKDHLQQVLGTQKDLMRINLAVLYPVADVQLSPLIDDFTHDEVYVAVRNLLSNKVVGPDGLPHEFIKHY